MSPAKPTAATERFTDRARKALTLANQEPARMNHDSIGTHHILLGIVKEGGGVAAAALRDLHIDLAKVGPEVEKLVGIGKEPVTPDKLPQTPRAEKAIDYSILEAQSLGHNYVGTEHLLLGLIRETDGVAAQVLRNLQVQLDPLRESILKILARQGREA